MRRRTVMERAAAPVSELRSGLRLREALGDPGALVAQRRHIRAAVLAGARLLAVVAAGALLRLAQRGRRIRAAAVAGGLVLTQ